MSIVYNDEDKNQIVYKVNLVESDDEDENIEEIVKIDHNATVILSTQLTNWQKIIGNYQITDINQIIEHLTDLKLENNNSELISRALIDAKQYLYQQSLNDRKNLSIKKDLSVDQFGNRVKMDYNRSILDEQYRVVQDAKKRSEEENNKPKPKIAPKPAPKNFGTKKFTPSLFQPAQITSPDQW